jgi:radical SAM superfamily enzyme YgiQ (UPF0313 family)
MESASRRSGLRVLLVGLFSERYPAAGETHGLSVIAGAIHSEFHPELTDFTVIDLVTFGREDSRLIEQQMKATDPHVLSISVPYGTYDLLLELREIIRAHVGRGGLAIVGGALPTYIGPKILSEIDDRIIVVQGEGDTAAPAIIHAWQDKRQPGHVPNVLFFDAGTITATPRVLADSKSIAVPYREHLRTSIGQGIQVYAEASRGCSWAACTFCLRGLTDVKGTQREYRRLPLQRLEHDIRQLRELGATQFTFADEDFIGGDTESFSAVVEMIAALQTEDPSRTMTFDASATTKSIFDESDSTAETARKAERLRRLKEVGLNKVFLGVESGSTTQLKRYAKGHTPAEIVRACATVLDCDVKLELGFIMFDPLCTPAEIIENSSFLLDNALAALVSGPTSELRLQVGSRYINVLTRMERQLGQRLFRRDVDPNTLSHEYQYADAKIGRLAAEVRSWDSVVHPFIYATKGLTRHGKGVLQTAEHERIKHMLGRYREASLKALRAAALSGRASDYRTGTIPAVSDLIRSVQQISLAGLESRHPMVSTLADESTRLAAILIRHSDHHSEKGVQE